MKKLLGVLVLLGVVFMPFNMMTVFAESFYVNHYHLSGSCDESGFLVYGLMEVNVPPDSYISNTAILNGIIIDENWLMYDGSNGWSNTLLFPTTGFPTSLPYHYELVQVWYGYDGRPISLTKTDVFCSALGTLSVTDTSQHFSW